MVAYLGVGHGFCVQFAIQTQLNLLDCANRLLALVHLTYQAIYFEHQRLVDSNGMYRIGAFVQRARDELDLRFLHDVEEGAWQWHRKSDKVHKDLLEFFDLLFVN